MTFTTRPLGPQHGGAGEQPHRPDPSSGPEPGPAVEHALDGAPSGASTRRRRRWPWITAAALVPVLAGGTAAYAHAHKTVELDVDGELRTVQTFAGSVEGLLEAEGVVVGARDTVSATGSLRDGAELVVRHAQAVTVRLDGEEQVVWTTALTADEALETLATRSDRVALVASRSAAGGRAELPLELALTGAAEVLVDGETHAVPEADATVASVLGELGVELGPLDRVAVRHADDGTVQVVVSRVAVENVTTEHEVAFTSREQEDAGRYVGTRAVAQEGQPGVRTLVERVTTVNGKVTERETVSDDVTREPVEEVVAVGTKVRPVAPAPAPAAAPAASASSGAATSTPVAPGGSADSLNWAALAQCESGGRVDVVSASGRYHGLYQFSVATWQSVGGAGLPSAASAEEQTARAKMLYNRSGAGQWPHCGPRLFS